jgi:D-inositol-3-phosphate glycosyltransferase
LPLRDRVAVALLTGGRDRPYVFGLAGALAAGGVTLDLIGSDDLDFAEFRGHPRITFLNLRKDQRHDASFAAKLTRVVAYYAKLIRYAAAAKPELFHILWNNKVEYFDRTALMLYYKLLGKQLVLTAHNVNAGRRDLTDTFLNRFTLRAQYRLADHIFVHTQAMKGELTGEFGVPPGRITVIPFGINNAVPETALTGAQARERLGIGRGEKVLLFFGRITPYKGLEYLVPAFRQVLASDPGYKLVIAGRAHGFEAYWAGIEAALRPELEAGRIVLKAEFIPDEETEVYFKAADILVLPYRHIYQSGVLFLGQRFGLPVLAADVGSLKDDIIEGETGYLFQPEDAGALVRAIERYFCSDLYRDLSGRRPLIREYATRRHSWADVMEASVGVYSALLRLPRTPQTSVPELSKASPDKKS